MKIIFLQNQMIWGFMAATIYRSQETKNGHNAYAITFNPQDNDLITVTASVARYVKVSDKLGVKLESERQFKSVLLQDEDNRQVLLKQDEPDRKSVV